MSKRLRRRDLELYHFSRVTVEIRIDVVPQEKDRVRSTTVLSKRMSPPRLLVSRISNRGIRQMLEKEKEKKKGSSGRPLIKTGKTDSTVKYIIFF